MSRRQKSEGKQAILDASWELKKRGIWNEETKATKSTGWHERCRIHEMTVVKVLGGGGEE